jgi:hypothetical protein
MIEFTEYRRNAGAPTLFVNRIRGIYRLSQALMKVTFVLATGNEAVKTVSLLWEHRDLYEADDNMRFVLNEIRQGTLRFEDGVRRIRAC